MSIFMHENGNWTDYRKLPNYLEIDLHRGEGYGGYGEQMEEIREDALKILASAQNEGKKYVIFCHGHSTSKIGKTTTRSVIRSVMRSKEATPYIIRSKCVQHYSVFVAAIKPKFEHSA
jgi:hypothetical protein